jgi:hypothetical protein
MINQKNADIPSSTLPFPAGFEVCWAGPNPLGDGFCLGAEDGLLQLFENDRPVGPAIQASASSEAINSVAGIGKWLAVSTRREMNFIHFVNFESMNGKMPRFRTPFGAHHVGVTNSGYFVATLGRAGLFFADMAKDDLLITTPGSDFCAYRLLIIPEIDGNDVIVCAGRSGGIAFGAWHPSQSQTKMQTMSFAGFDAIDVCSIGSAENPRAIAALGRDGSLVLFRDILNDPKPGTLKYATLSGTAYRAVCCRGHLFVLTSDGLYGLWNLAENFVHRDSSPDWETQILVMPIQSIDINVVAANRILVVELENVIQINVDAIVEESSVGNRLPVIPQILKPDWTNRSMLQTSKEVALTA